MRSRHRGRPLHNEQFAPFMAMSILGKHQIFMQALAGQDRQGQVAQMLVASQPPPMPFLVFLRGDFGTAEVTQAIHFHLQMPPDSPMA